MAFTNSPLATYINISKNKHSPRNHKIDTITIHCYVGQVTAKQGCDYFATTTRQVSSNYVVGKDGSIGLSVDEKDRSWCSSNASNDHRAITIEVACDKTAPYAVTDAAYSALIELIADICKRNDIKELKWQGDKSLIGQVDKQNMTVHRWFSNTECPGGFLYDRQAAIATAVNKKLGQTTKEEGKVMYRVQIGAFSKKENAENCLAKAKAAGFADAFIKAEVITEDKTETPKIVLKSIDEVARECINGLWGNGADRKNRLTEAGYDYKAVQDRINELV